MKKSFFAILSLIVAGLVFAGCKEKKKTDVIITEPVVKKVSNDTLSMDKLDAKSDVQWNGSNYHISIASSTDKSMPVITDEGDNKYYDNKVTLRITRADGSSFFDKTFTKNDFKEYVSADYFENNALAGFVFDKVENGVLLFAVAVGSPDKFSDNFIPLDFKISKTGDVSIAVSQRDLVDPSTDEGV